MPTARVKGKTRTTRGAESAAVAAAAAGPWEGFFLPAALRARLVTTKTPHEEVSYLHGGRCGVDCEAAAPGSVTVRWPLLTAAEWAEIVQELRGSQVDLNRISDLISQDTAMTAKILQLVNSAFFGMDYLAGLERIASNIRF